MPYEAGLLNHIRDRIYEITYLVTRDVRTIITLTICTSPAELGLATPLVMIAAIARAARTGILIQGGFTLKPWRRPM